MFRKMTMILLALVGLAATARADVAKGDVCATHLSAVGKQIYAATVAANPTLLEAAGMMTKSPLVTLASAMSAP